MSLDALTPLPGRHYVARDFFRKITMALDRVIQSHTVIDSNKESMMSSENRFALFGIML